MVQSNTPIIHAFTTSFDGIALRLTNEVKIVYEGREFDAPALWDTGATMTCLSKDAVDTLGLVPTGKAEIKTPSGKCEVSTYLVDLVLQNNVRITGVQVCESEIGEQGIGALIGMDIIAVGDFAVSNKDGKTCFSFRIPPVARTDYVKEIQVSNLIGQKHGQGKRKQKAKKKR